MVIFKISYATLKSLLPTITEAIAARRKAERTRYQEFLRKPPLEEKNFPPGDGNVSR